ncbi:hypothetical protein HYH03_010005 [Edaphochlamys debaryana]|uniref:Uncharacterized protein n=1 Tax=Edaphochlamys debaryana TaxID=47281 RepID=A0A836BXW4_9CHLO|nr:hypothetical protein HYH03_010005 [Edaphochlamys debaryana]|eukprot:KAG2491634.1 hypothetical protein HYH03_010005 [Edaphochlamys debaryana]
MLAARLSTLAVASTATSAGHVWPALPRPAASPARPIPCPLRPTRNPVPSRSVRAHIFDGLRGMLGGKQQEQQPSKPSEDVVEWNGPDSDGEPGEEEEGEYEDEEGTMLRIDQTTGGLAEEGGAFGPLAALLVGFMAEEVQGFRQLMADMEAEGVKIIPCTPAQLKGTLSAAFEAETPAYQQPPLGTRRTVFLSGMFGGEMVDVIASYKETGLPTTVWAAAVPNNWGRVVSDLVAEVHADNAAMKARKAEEEARRAAMGGSGSGSE